MDCPRYGEHAEFVKALTELRAALDNDRISIESEDLKRHGYSEWATTNIDTTPIVIAYPKAQRKSPELPKSVQSTGCQSSAILAVPPWKATLVLHMAGSASTL